MQSKPITVMSHKYSIHPKAFNCKNCGLLGPYYHAPTKTYVMRKGYVMLCTNLELDFQFYYKWLPERKDELEIVPGCCKNLCEQAHERTARLLSVYGVPKQPDQLLRYYSP